jgi:hypothetical protein
MAGGRSEILEMEKRLVKKSSFSLSHLSRERAANSQGTQKA